MVTIRRMETTPLVRDVAPLAATAYGTVASPRVRNTASIGGNVAHGDYRLDPPVALLALEGAIGALAPVPRLATADVTGRTEEEVVEAALEAAGALMDPIPDVRGGVEYKRALGRVAVEDAVPGLS